MKRYLSLSSILSVIVGVVALVGYNYFFSSNKLPLGKVEQSQNNGQEQIEVPESPKDILSNPAIEKRTDEKLPSTLRLKMLDRATGIRVIPESIMLRQRENKDVTYTFDGGQVENNGVIVIPLKNGTYDLIVTASGYQQMTSFFTFNNDSLNINFNLESLIPKQELSATYIKKFHRKDALVIVGFITDDPSGKPMEGVAVFSEDKVAQSYSQKNGFFQLALPLIENYSQAEKRGRVFFSKNGYTTEVRSNFDMYPNGDMILPISLKLGTGINSEEILKKRAATYVTISEATQTE